MAHNISITFALEAIAVPRATADSSICGDAPILLPNQRDND
jgi:hypothetical protein